MIADLVRKVFCRRGKPEPADLQEFRAASANLIRNARALGREADAFGDMVRGMRGERRSKKKRNAKR